MSHRFFVETDVDDQIVLAGEQAHQIANVLRLSSGDQITLVRSGIESLVVLESVDASEVRGRCVSKRSVDAEPRVHLTLALPILRGDRTEEVIEAVHDWARLFDALDAPILVAWESEVLVKLQDAVSGPRLSLVIGPEGGLAADEVARARERAAVTVSLGPRNLRSETAAVAAVAQAMAILER